MVLSVRRAASRELRKACRTARANGAVRPPWRRSWGRFGVGVNQPGPVRLLVYLATWVALLTGISLARPASDGVAAATIGVLEVLWQVQAASVGLVFALVVFVFGLLPAGRGRLTYRQFLRRTHAVGLTLLNVGSLIFNGLVVLGVGHQLPSTASAAGHGWALTVASATGITSIASIAVLLAWTVRAMDPAGKQAVHADYRHAVVAWEVRRELHERASLGVTFGLSDSRVLEFSPSYAGRGHSLTAGGAEERVVRDVSVWRLRIMGSYASRRRQNRPVLRVWPGRRVMSATPLITVDPGTGPLGRLWARRCIRVSPAPPDALGSALNALHADTLDDIRGERPVEAVAGMQALAALHETIWHAYSAYGLVYDYDARQVFYLYRRTVGDQLIPLLDDEVRAAVVSRDDRIRGEAAALPRRLAGDALAAEAAWSIQQALGMLLSAYSAAVNDLTDEGRLALPITATARARVQAPFQSLLSFTHSNLPLVIDKAAGLGTDPELTSETVRIARSAQFAAEQLQAAHRQLLAMVLRAMRLGDPATVCEALAVWKVPDLYLIREALEDAEAKAVSAASDPGLMRGEAAGPLRQLDDTLDAARDSLDVMFLQLLAEATAGETAAPRQHVPGGGSGQDTTCRDDTDAPDPVVTALLDRLPTGRLWHCLETASRMGISSLTSPFEDGGIFPAGVVRTAWLTDAAPAVLDAFAFAAIARPDLTAATVPGGQAALAAEAEVSAAIDRLLSGRLWLLARYGVSEESARLRGADLKNEVAAAARQARDEQEEKIRVSPIVPSAVSTAEAELRSAFPDADITSRLLGWAGWPRLAGPREDISGHCIFLPVCAPRTLFIDGGDPAGVGQWLADMLAKAFLQQVLRIASDGAQAHRITPADGAMRVREAIAEVQSINGMQKGLVRRAPAKAVVIIPDVPYDLRRDIGVTATEADAWRSEDQRRERAMLMEQLGVAGTGLALRVAGLIDGTPVIKTRAITRQIVVLDLSKLARHVRAVSDEVAVEPHLSVIEPAGPDTTTTASSSHQVSRVAPVEQGNLSPGPSSSATGGHTLQVQLRAWLLADISVPGTNAAQVLTWDEWQPVSAQ